MTISSPAVKINHFSNVPPRSRILPFAVIRGRRPPLSPLVCRPWALSRLLSPSSPLHSSRPLPRVPPTQGPSQGRVGSLWSPQMEERNQRAGRLRPRQWIWAAVWHLLSPLSHQVRTSYVRKTTKNVSKQDKQLVLLIFLLGSAHVAFSFETF